jgi:hypothetical protein
MFLLAAALLQVTSTAPEPRRVSAPLVQAQATVRIISGVRLQLGEANAVGGQRLRLTSVSTPQGVQSAKLVEFE